MSKPIPTIIVIEKKYVLKILCMFLGSSYKWKTATTKKLIGFDPNLATFRTGHLPISIDIVNVPLKY